MSHLLFRIICNVSFTYDIIRFVALFLITFININIINLIINEISLAARYFNSRFHCFTSSVFSNHVRTQTCSGTLCQLNYRVIQSSLNNFIENSHMLRYIVFTRTIC